MPPSHFAANNMDFLKSKRAPFDIKFFVDDAVLEAHKLVVAARSDWFTVVIYGHGDGNKGMETTWVEERVGRGGIKTIIKILLY
jgi:hypothetical protein